MLFLLASLTAVTAVSAHAELLAAFPGPGDVLLDTPDEIRLAFNEPISAGSDLFVFTDGFQYVDGIEAQIDPEDATVLFSPLPPLVANEYNVQWSAISADGHAVSGTYTFRVSEESAPASTPLFILGGLLLLILVAGITGGIMMTRPYRVEDE